MAVCAQFEQTSQKIQKFRFCQFKNWGQGRKKMVQTGLLTPERGVLDLLDTYQSAEMQRPLARRIFFQRVSVNFQSSVWQTSEFYPKTRTSTMPGIGIMKSGPFWWDRTNKTRTNGKPSVVSFDWHLPRVSDNGRVKFSQEWKFYILKAWGRSRGDMGGVGTVQIHTWMGIFTYFGFVQTT